MIIIIIMLPRRGIYKPHITRRAIVNRTIMACFARAIVSASILQLRGFWSDNVVDVARIIGCDYFAGEIIAVCCTAYGGNFSA